MTQDPFVKSVGLTLRDMNFEAHWPHKPFNISLLKTSIKEPSQIEIDIVAKIGNVGFLIEITTDQTLSRNKKKIKTLISKYRAINSSKLPIKDLIAKFSGIPHIERKKFCNIKQWKAVYVGTSEELVYNEITADKFTDGEGLTIINIDDWGYITTLQKMIKAFARFEFISYLNLDPEIVEGIKDTDQFFDYFKVEDLNITKDPLDTDIYLFEASPGFLLRTCRVFRFFGLPISDSKRYYQRMLNKNKLTEVRSFINNSPKRSFPTPITVVLPPEVNITSRRGKSKLAIPFKYGSIELIDGQHRLYAYASPSIQKNVRENAKIIVNGIRFKSQDIGMIKKLSARTFIDINREQMKVKTSLIYSISYDTMGDISDDSLAGKIISECNSDKYSPLHDLLEGRTIGRKSRFDTERTKIVEVTKTFGKLIGKIRDPTSSQAKQVMKMLNLDTYSDDPKDIIDVGKKLINRYFNKVVEVFSDDWMKNTKSLILYAKYMAAFIRLLSDSIDKGHSFREVKERLKSISKNLSNNTEWKNSDDQIPTNEKAQIFHKGRDAIPPAAQFSSGKIFKGLLWYETNKTIWPELISGE